MINLPFLRFLSILTALKARPPYHFHRESPEYWLELNGPKKQLKILKFFVCFSEKVIQHQLSAFVPTNQIKIIFK